MKPAPYKEVWGCKVERKGSPDWDFEGCILHSSASGDLIVSQMQDCTCDPIAWFAAGTWDFARVVLVSEKQSP